MSVLERSAKRGLIGRAWGILFRTEVEWEVIDGERATVLGLFLGYACILAAIKPIAQLPQHMMIPHWRPGPTLEIMALGYGLSLAGVLILGLIINALAPTYHGQKNLVQAMKLSVYFHTPGWVVGFIYVLAIPDFLDKIADLYGLYILCLGLPTLMRSSRDETVGYFVGVVFAAVVIGLVTAWMLNMTSLYLLGDAPLSGASAAVGR